MTGPTATEVATHLARRADAVIRKALVARLGPDFTNAEVVARCSAVCSPGGDTYLLDGVEFLWIGPVKISEGPEGVFSVDREWREVPA
jgi:hypothetical protein